MNERLLRIGEALRTQDNRATDAPIFIVEKKVRDYGFMPDYAEDYVWVNRHTGDGDIADEVLAARLNKKDQEGRSTGRWEKIYYRERWEFVTACFTEQGCQEYLRLDGHNLPETRIYAAGSYRNNEYRDVREFLMNSMNSTTTILLSDTRAINRAKIIDFLTREGHRVELGEPMILAELKPHLIPQHIEFPLDTKIQGKRKRGRNYYKPAHITGGQP